MDKIEKWGIENGKLSEHKNLPIKKGIEFLLILKFSNPYNYEILWCKPFIF